MGIITRSIANNIVTGGKLDGTDGLSGVISASNIANDSLTNITALSSSLGDAIESVATDPVSPSEGQLWYNTTIGVLKAYDGTLAAWASGGNMGTAREQLAGAGTQTVGLAFGGTTGSAVVNTEEYDGSTWVSGGNMGTARTLLAGCGTQTVGLAFGGTTGSLSTATEEYNGTSWGPGGNMGTARRQLGGAGIQTAALGFGGFTTVDVATTEEYDGSAWTAGGNLGTARRGLAGCGTQTVGLGFGGYTTGVGTSLATDEYDGSVWTAGGNMNTARSNLAGCGTQTSALALVVVLLIIVQQNYIMEQVGQIQLL
jgi:hypothetical protein